MKKKYPSIIETATIQEAIKKLDSHKDKLNLLVVHNYKKKVTGIFTMGDFRRAVFKGLDINSKISTLVNTNFMYLIKNFSKDKAKEIFNTNSLILNIPILNKKFELVKIITRKDVFSSSELKRKNIDLKNFPVVIMAGGKGTRLDPFTRVLPKSLIPIGNEPILKIIIDNFVEFSLNNFYISINEKRSMIKAYLNDFKSSYKIQYIEEKKPMGTAGSLRLLKHKLKSTFFVTNCDIIIYSHYPSIIEFHKKNNYDLTLISSIRNYVIPYGICDMDDKGQFIGIREKPNHSLFANTGFYVLEPKVLNFIPANRKFDMDELIIKVKKKGMRIGVFSVSENSWIDIGQLSEYKKYFNKFSF
jgi:dTDP-glucose pyrophosphorylase/CBS domain-containing protein